MLQGMQVLWHILWDVGVPPRSLSMFPSSGQVQRKWDIARGENSTSTLYPETLRRMSPLKTSFLFHPQLHFTLQRTLVTLKSFSFQREYKGKGVSLATWRAKPPPLSLSPSPLCVRALTSCLAQTSWSCGTLDVKSILYNALYVPKEFVFHGIKYTQANNCKMDNVESTSLFPKPKMIRDVALSYLSDWLWQLHNGDVHINH